MQIIKSCFLKVAPQCFRNIFENNCEKTLFRNNF